MILVKRLITSLLLSVFLFGMTPGIVQKAEARKYGIYHYVGKDGRVYHAYKKPYKKKRWSKNKKWSRKKKRHYRYTVRHTIYKGKVRHKIVPVRALW